MLRPTAACFWLHLAGHCLFALSASATLGATEPAPARIYHAVVESSGQPFTFADEQGRATGFAVELLRAVAQDQNLAIKVTVAPWPEIFANFRTGQYDILGNIAYTRERAAIVDFAMPNLVQYGGIFARDDGPPLRTRRDLAGKRLAVLSESRGHDYARQQNWQAVLVPVMSLVEGIEDVRAGRVDALLSMQLVTTHLLRKNDYRDIVLTSIDCNDLSYQMHFGLHAGDANLLARLNEGLLAAHSNGTYAKLYEKWLGPLQPRSLRLSDVRPYLLPAAGLILAIVLAFGWQRRVLRRVSRQAEKLRLSEERLSLVLEGSQDAFWDWNMSAEHVQRSPRWTEMLGYAPGEIGATNEDFFKLVHPDDAHRIRTEQDMTWRGRDQFSNELRMRTKAGEWKWILDRGKVVARDPISRQPLRATGTHSDITERKKLEEEHARLQAKMLETQKLESLGVLAGGIAHDFNNLLTVILGNTSLVRLDSALTPDGTKRLDNILTASNRAADLCRQLLAYAGKGSFAIGPVNLNEVVQETAQLLELTLSPKAEVVFTLAPDLPPVEADPSQIRQIVMNLVINASEAIGGESGLIRLNTQVARFTAHDLTVKKLTPEIEPGTYVFLEISDSGCGMTPEVLGKIFDPFFSTKFTGRGLGLAAVLGIVRSHKGTVRVESRVGLGSTFRIFLPAAPDAATSKSPASPAPFSPKSVQHVVLVVDDEGPVRHLVMEVLKVGGYETVGAEDGRAALEIFRADPTRFTCVLLDLTMPGIDGPATLTAMRTLRPDVIGILMSGYSELDARASIAASGAVDFIQKPFTPEVLFRKLAAACRAEK